MKLTTVVIEDRDGDEWTGVTKTQFSVKEDQIVTIQIYNGKYISGYVIEIKGEKDESSSTFQPR